MCKETSKSLARRNDTRRLSEAGAAAAHDLALADELGAELGAVEREIDVEVYPVERPLRRVHALKVLLEVLPGQVRRKSDNLPDSCKKKKG